MRMYVEQNYYQLKKIMKCYRSPFVQQKQKKIPLTIFQKDENTIKKFGKYKKKANRRVVDPGRGRGRGRGSYVWIKLVTVKLLCTFL
jgi:hypothetical protein